MRARLPSKSSLRRNRSKGTREQLKFSLIYGIIRFQVVTLIKVVDDEKKEVEEKEPQAHHPLDEIATKEREGNSN